MSFLQRNVFCAAILLQIIFARQVYAWDVLTPLQGGKGSLSMLSSEGFCGPVVIAGRFAPGMTEVIAPFQASQSVGLWKWETYNGNRMSVACSLYTRFSKINSPSYLQYGFNCNNRSDVYEMKKSNSFCYLSAIYGKFDGSHDSVWIWDWADWKNQSYWLAIQNKSGILTGANSTCITLDPNLAMPRNYYGVSQGEPDVRMYHQSEGACYLVGMSGRFQGYGEEIGIYIGQDGYYWLYARSQQWGVRVSAVCVPYSNG